MKTSYRQHVHILKGVDKHLHEVTLHNLFGIHISIYCYFYVTHYVTLCFCATCFVKQALLLLLTQQKGFDLCETVTVSVATSLKATCSVHPSAETDVR